MANVKKIIAEWSETGKTVYCIIRREADNFLLDDATGSFGAAPADPYVSLAEDATIKGLYQLNESRQVWNDGRYTISVYKQAGGSPSPVADSIIGSGDMFIYGDTELAGSVWDEINSNHLTGATTGKDLFDAYNASLGTYNTIQDPLFGNPALKAAIIAIPPAPTVGAIDTQLSGTHGTGQWGLGSGAGDTGVNHNTPTADAMRIVNQSGQGIADVRIIAYLQSDYLAGNTGTSFIKGSSITGVDGRWLTPIMLQSGNTYVIVFSESGYKNSTQTITI